MIVDRKWHVDEQGKLFRKTTVRTERDERMGEIVFTCCRLCADNSDGLLLTKQTFLSNADYTEFEVTLVHVMPPERELPPWVNQSK